MFKITTKTPVETKKVASALAREILNPAPASRGGVKTPRAKGAFVLALEGNLGAGKTTFVQGFAKGLGIKDIPKSPTFILMNIYPFGKAQKVHPPKFFKRKTWEGKKRKAHGTRHLVHIDCYRVASPKELLHLGIKEIFKDPQNIVVIEWAERVRKLLPREILRVRFRHGKQKHIRTLQISNS